MLTYDIRFVFGGFIRKTEGLWRHSRFLSLFYSETFAHLLASTANTVDQCMDRSDPQSDPQSDPHTVDRSVDHTVDRSVDQCVHGSFCTLSSSSPSGNAFTFSKSAKRTIG